MLNQQKLSTLIMSEQQQYVVSTRERKDYSKNHLGHKAFPKASILCAKYFGNLRSKIFNKCIKIRSITTPLGQAGSNYVPLLRRSVFLFTKSEKFPKRPSHIILVLTKSRISCGTTPPRYLPSAPPSVFLV